MRRTAGGLIFFLAEFVAAAAWTDPPYSYTYHFHSVGALASIVGGNALIIILGRLHRHAGITQKTGKAMVILGVFGLVSLLAFLTIAGSDSGIIGIVERCAVYPTLIALCDLP